MLHVAQAYGWLGVWYIFFVFEACWVKFVCDTGKGAQQLHA